MPYVTSVERMALKRVREEGRQEAREEGYCEGVLECLEFVLRFKFGAIDKRLWKKLQAIKKKARMREVIQIIETATSPDELRQLMRK